MRVICTRLPLGRLSVRAGESSRRSEEIVETTRLAPLNVIIIIIAVSRLLDSPVASHCISGKLLREVTCCHTEIKCAWNVVITLPSSPEADRYTTLPEQRFVVWLVANVPATSQGRICSDNFTCCHTEIEVADPTFYLTQSQYTDTGPTSPSADPITPGAWR